MKLADGCLLCLATGRDGPMLWGFAGYVAAVACAGVHGGGAEDSLSAGSSLTRVQAKCATGD